VTDLGESDVRRAKGLLDKYGIRVSNIATAFLKAALPGTTPIPNQQMKEPFGIYPYEEHYPLLNRAFEKAKAFGVDKVRIFSFWRVGSPGEVFERVKEHLVAAAGIAEKAGIVLMLENEYACNVGTATELAAMLKAIRSNYLTGLWDPGNCFFLGERPYPDGYKKLDVTRIQHMHLKDAMYDAKIGKRRWVPIGSGETNIPEQLGDLIRDRYAGVISVETHYVPEGRTAADGSLQSVTGLRKIIQSL
jgi:sugar phosphate isomerase/epimerase